MTQEVVEITLPKSNMKVGLRNYVTVGDRRRISRLVMSGTKFDVEANGKDDAKTPTPQKMELAGDKLLEVNDERVRCLLISVDGDTKNMFDKLMSLRDEEDMKAVEKKVNEIFGDGEDTEKK